MTFHDISTSKAKDEMLWIKSKTKQANTYTNKQTKYPIHLLENKSQLANCILFQTSLAILTFTCANDLVFAEFFLDNSMCIISFNLWNDITY